MTDQEKLRALLDEWGVPYDGDQTITVTRGDHDHAKITGYRGFLIRDQPDSGSVRLIRVYGGSVEIPGRGVFLDPDRKVERWLLESAGDAVDPEMRALVLRELEARPR